MVPAFSCLNLYLHNPHPCRSCRRLRSFDLVFKQSKSKDRSLRQLLQGAYRSGSLRIKIENANPRQQIRFRQVRMLMPPSAQYTSHDDPDIEGKAANETLLLVVRGDEVQTILVFSVKLTRSMCVSRRAWWCIPHDEAVTQDSHRSIVTLFVVKAGAGQAGFGRIAPRSSVWRLPH